MHPYLRIMRLDNPVGSLLLLWPTLAALCMAADGPPPLKLVVIFTLGTFLMRAAGCVINDYADRHVDGGVERTRNRPFVTGAMQPREALILFGVLAAAAGSLTLFLSHATKLWAVAGLAVAALYPFMKRWTYLPQTVLGAAFSWGILMAWSATVGQVSQAAWLYFAASVVWIVGYDTLYAMVDREDDIKIGIKSTAVLFGALDRVMVGALQIITVFALLLLGLRLGYEHVYFAGVLAGGGLFIYQQYLIRKREPARCLEAFRNNTWVGFALLVGTIGELVLRGYLAQ